MVIKSVSLVGSFSDARGFPERGGPEIAFLGRSNVGKSSLINTLLGRRNVARTSNTPGKTRTANYYLVNGAFLFVDMPGYGYARVSKDERARWAALVSRYLAERATLCCAVHVLDSRRTPDVAEREAVASLQETGRRFCLAFNKIDKLTRGAVRKTISGHLCALEVSPDVAVVAFSSQTGEGKRELWRWLAESLGVA